MCVPLGDAIATGMPAEPLLDEVYHSNMTKMVVIEQTGKGTNGNDFQPPIIHPSRGMFPLNEFGLFDMRSNVLGVERKLV